MALTLSFKPRPLILERQLFSTPFPSPPWLTSFLDGPFIMVGFRTTYFDFDRLIQLRQPHRNMLHHEPRHGLAQRIILTGIDDAGQRLVHQSHHLQQPQVRQRRSEQPEKVLPLKRVHIRRLVQHQRAGRVKGLLSHRQIAAAQVTRHELHHGQWAESPSAVDGLGQCAEGLQRGSLDRVARETQQLHHASFNVAVVHCAALGGEAGGAAHGAESENLDVLCFRGGKGKWVSVFSSVIAVIG